MFQGPAALPAEGSHVMLWVRSPTPSAGEIAARLKVRSLPAHRLHAAFVVVPDSRQGVNR
jgi:hypothetical protein